MFYLSLTLTLLQTKICTEVTSFGAEGGGIKIKIYVYISQKILYNKIEKLIDWLFNHNFYMRALKEEVQHHPTNPTIHVSVQAYPLSSITQERKMKLWLHNSEFPLIYIFLHIVDLLMTKERKYSLLTHVDFLHSHRKSRVFKEGHRAFLSMSQYCENSVPSRADSKAQP